jgi:hypothetical protein
MKTIQKALVLTMGLSLMASAAEAKGAKKHCMKDGAEIADSTKKTCKAAGGKWEKIAAPAKEAPKAAPAATP